MNAKTSRILLLFGACLLALRAGAQQTPVVNEDIDLYLATTGVGSTCGCSNVLIFLDNASYWSNTYTPPFGANTTRFASEIAALNQIIPSLSGSVNVGIMMGVLNGSDSTYPAPNTNSKILGGVVRYALRPMTAA